MQEIIIISDSARGVYIPRHFAETIKRERVTGVSDLQWEDLESDPYGIDSDILWETWDRVLDNARVTCPDTGTVFVLYQDGDLFLVPENQLESWLGGMQ